MNNDRERITEADERAVESGVPRPTHAERDHRLQVIAQWLIEGKPRGDALIAIQATFQVSRRTAQAYLHDTQAMLAADAAEQEELFYLRMSQWQRDRLLEAVLSFSQALNQVDPKVLRNLSLLVASACRLMDGRNRTAGQIRQMLRDAERNIANREAPEKPVDEQRPSNELVSLEDKHRDLTARLAAIAEQLEQSLGTGENVARNVAESPRHIPQLPSAEAVAATPRIKNMLRSSDVLRRCFEDPAVAEQVAAVLRQPRSRPEKPAERWRTQGEPSGRKKHCARAQTWRPDGASEPNANRHKEMRDTEALVPAGT
jgi:hypothetical protein